MIVASFKINMKRSKEEKKKWKKIIVEIDGKVNKYDLNNSEKLSHKFHTKLRKNVTKKYKEYIKSHPNIKVKNMEELSFGYDAKQFRDDSLNQKTKYQTKSYKEEIEKNPKTDTFELIFDEKSSTLKESDDCWDQEEFFL